MNHHAHLIAGLTSGLIVSGTLLNYVQLEIALVGGTACFLGSEFPDLDTNSTPSKIFARVAFGVTMFLYWLGKIHYVALVGMFFLLIKGQPHRGITHSYLLPLVLFITSGLIAEYSVLYAVISWCFGLGLIVHSAVDRRNPFNLKSWSL